MDSNALCAQIVDSQDTTDDVPPKVVENKNLPYGLPIFTQEGCGLRTARGVDTWDRARGFFMVQAQDSLNGT